MDNQKPYPILAKSEDKKKEKRSVIYQKVASSTVLAYAPPPISRPIPAAVNNLPCSSNSL